jgi:hypothetical protein
MGAPIAGRSQLAFRLEENASFRVERCVDYAILFDILNPCADSFNGLHCLNSLNGSEAS